MAIRVTDTEHLVRVGQQFIVLDLHDRPARNSHCETCGRLDDLTPVEASADTDGYLLVCRACLPDPGDFDGVAAMPLDVGLVDDALVEWEAIPAGANTVTCWECHRRHQATYSHEGQFGEGPIYAVVCGQFTTYYTAEALDV